MPATSGNYADVPPAELLWQVGPHLFAKEPVPQEKGESAEEKKKKTHAASEARATLRLAKKYAHILARRQISFCSLNPEQQRLVEQLRDGTLEREANRLTLLSGHGRIKRKDGTSVDIGGSTGGFTRAVLYNWTPPNIDDEFQ